MPLAVGFIDNLYISPAGEVTVVEAKLWRNPEARRKVVGQILDYAAALASMSYEDLEDAVRDANGDDLSIWERIRQSPHPSPPVAEAAFVDTVRRGGSCRLSTTSWAVGSSAPAWCGAEPCEGARAR